MCSLYKFLQLIMLVIMNYLNQQLANMMPIIVIIKVLFIIIHTVFNFAVSLYLIISLILMLGIFTYTIFIYYDKILYLPKERIFEYLLLLFCGTILKKYILFTKFILFLHKFSEQLLIILIKILLFIMEFAKKIIITFKQQNVCDVFIFIVVVKITYLILNEAIRFAIRNNVNDLYEKLCDIIDNLCSIISYIVYIILFILGIVMICVLYNYILYIQYTSIMRLQNIDNETLNEILDNHLFK